MPRNLPALPESMAAGRRDLLMILEDRILTEAAAAHEAIVRIRLSLLEIQNQGLWRDAGFRTMDAYCQDRLGMNRSAKYRAIVWAREALAEFGSPEGVLAAPEEVLPTGRSAFARARANDGARPPRGKGHAVDVAAIPARRPTTAARTAPEPPPPVPSAAPVEQLTLFPATRLLEHLINERGDEVLAIEGTDKRKALAARFRRWADALDPAPKRSLARASVTPNPKGKR